MKPAKFEYYDPSSIEHAVEILSVYQQDGKVLAGGQSLMPLLNMRLARPRAIIDINQIKSLDYIRATGSYVAIGAATRQRALEQDSLIRERLPLLREAASYVAHPQIRSRGTLCGSLAHADPAAELPALAVALDAELVAQGSLGARTIPSDAFFVSYFTTSLDNNEILTEARFPVPPKDMAWSILEVSRRHGDFALVGVVAGLAVDRERETVTKARLVCFGVGPTPIRVKAAEDTLIGQRPELAVFKSAGQMVGKEIDPTSDIHATAEYRRAVAGTLTRRALIAVAGRLDVNIVER